MAKQKSLQKISIVFEETGTMGQNKRGNPGKMFNVYLEGMTRELKHVNPDDLSAAEFWATRCFSIVMHAIQAADVVHSKTPNPTGGIKQ